MLSLTFYLNKWPFLIAAVELWEASAPFLPCTNQRDFCKKFALDLQVFTWSYQGNGKKSLLLEFRLFPACQSFWLAIRNCCFISLSQRCLLLLNASLIIGYRVKDLEWINLPIHFGDPSGLNCTWIKREKLCLETVFLWCYDGFCSLPHSCFCLLCEPFWKQAMASYAKLFAVEVSNLEKEERCFCFKYLSCKPLWSVTVALDGGEEELCLASEREGCRGTLLSSCCAFFAGLFIGLKQFGIAPCITPFSSIEWPHMERRYIWPFLLTWRLEFCVFFSGCCSYGTTANSRQCVSEKWNPEASGSLY